ncbi:MAG TPA: hypothetical protein VGK09_11445 [Rhodocyclaceae bacterium]
MLPIAKAVPHAKEMTAGRITTGPAHPSCPTGVALANTHMLNPQQTVLPWQQFF